MHQMYSVHRVHGGIGIGAIPVAPAIGFGAVGIGAVPIGAIPTVPNIGNLNPAIFTPFYTTPNTVITQNSHYHSTVHYAYPFYPYY